MDVALRTIVIFGLVLVVTRVVGRRELSSMEPFDLILLVVVGDLIQQGVTQSDYSLTGTLIVLSVIAVMTVGTSYVSFRFPWARTKLEGEPIVLMEHGQIIERNLRRERMTHDELAAEARLQQIADLDRVHLAVLETNGHISFICEEPKGIVGGADA
jgi:uncharacterized membrane protein YcaP (DUF421 family)